MRTNPPLRYPSVRIPRTFSGRQLVAMAQGAFMCSPSARRRKLPKVLSQKMSPSSLKAELTLTVLRRRIHIRNQHPAPRITVCRVANTPGRQVRRDLSNL